MPRHFNFDVASFISSVGLISNFKTKRSSQSPCITVCCMTPGEENICCCISTRGDSLTSQSPYTLHRGIQFSTLLFADPDTNANVYASLLLLGFKRFSLPLLQRPRTSIRCCFSSHCCFEFACTHCFFVDQYVMVCCRACIGIGMNIPGTKHLDKKYHWSEAEL